MSQELKPHKVTKPIQLLAAWLLGLILVDGAFLTAAGLINTPPWAPGFLVISAVIFVPIFLACIFLLQTRFRPEMQEDTYYSRYLEVEQQTRKLGSSTDQVVQLRDMLVGAQEATNNGLSALYRGMEEIRAQLNGTVLGGDKESAEFVMETSQRILESAMSRLAPTRIDVQVNDLLPSYKVLLQRWLGTRIQVNGTFGRTSIPSTVPQFFVVAFGRAVSGEAMHEVCQSLAGTGQWYVKYSVLEISIATIYIGAYGYGGSEVAPLSDEFLLEMSRPGFSTELLVQWIGKNAVYLDADYPQPPPF